MKVRFRAVVTDFVPCKNGSSQEEEKHKVFMYRPVQRSAQDRMSCRPAALSCTAGRNFDFCPVLPPARMKVGSRTGQDRTKNLVLCSPVVSIANKRPVDSLQRHTSRCRINKNTELDCSSGSNSNIQHTKKRSFHWRCIFANYETTG